MIQVSGEFGNHFRLKNQQNSRQSGNFFRIFVIRKALWHNELPKNSSLPNDEGFVFFGGCVGVNRSGFMEALF